VLILRLISVVILVFLNGCASSPEIPSAQEEVIEPVKKAEPKEKLQKKEVKAPIDLDVMYMLMAAELAGQRGQYAIALDGYMEIAKHVKDPQFAERAAKIAMFMKDNNKVNEAVSIWLRQDPINPTARKIAALSSLTGGDKQAAVEHFNAVLKSDPAEFEKIIIELAGLMQKDGKLDFLNEVLDALVVKNPDQAIVYFVQSLLAMDMKNNVLAEKKIERALIAQPGWDKALVFQAQLAAFNGDLNKAETLLRNASVKFPENDKLKKLLAQVLIKAGEYEAAGDVYQSLVLANPKDAESQIALGLMHLQMHHDSQAEDVFKSLLDQLEWRNQASFYLGKIEEQRGHNQKAIAWFDKVTDGPLVLDSALSAISLLANDKKYEKADIRLNQLVGRFPKQKHRIILMQAGLYGSQELYDKAYKLLSDALITQPDQKEFLYARALIAERLNKADVLETDLKNLLVNYPDDAEALNALGYSLLNNPKRYADAEKYLQHALKLQPNEAVIMDSYGWLQYKQGRYEQALSYLQQAYEKQQENEIAAHLAEVLWAMGRKDEAKKLFNEAIKKAPEDEYLLDLKRRLMSGEE
jgi:tetratricopeptide (TPR) repeat protein